VVGAAVGITLAIAAEAGRVTLGRNFHSVVPGAVFRCAQLDGHDLQKTVRAHGILTIVNLRGCGPAAEWYLNECRVTHQLDVNQEDVSFSASRLPSVTEIRRLIDVLDHTEYPILFHCRQGADRTGLAAGVYLLLHTDSDLEAARRQLGLRYGHFRVGRAAHLDRFFDLYTEWLQTNSLVHTRATFREWAQHHYCPAECRCEFDPLILPERLSRDKPTHVRIRVHNRSLGPWNLSHESHIGFHLCFVLRDDAGRGVTSGRTGLFNDIIEPGQSVDLDFVIPPVHAPGRYHLLIDMVDELHCWFHQTGSEPLEQTVEVE
jgi:hypothetical protein